MWLRTRNHNVYLNLGFFKPILNHRVISNNQNHMENKDNFKIARAWQKIDAQIALFEREENLDCQKDPKLGGEKKPLYLFPHSCFPYFIFTNFVFEPTFFPT